MGVVGHLPLLLLILLLFDTGGLAKGEGLQYPCADTLDVVFVAEVRGESVKNVADNWHLTRDFILSLTERLLGTVRNVRVALVIYGDTYLRQCPLLEDLDEAVECINITDIYMVGKTTVAGALQAAVPLINDGVTVQDDRQAVIVLIAGQDIADLERIETRTAATVRSHATIIAVTSFNGVPVLANITGSASRLIYKRSATLHDTLIIGLDTSLAVICGSAQNRSKCGSQVDVVYIGQDTSGYVQDFTTQLFDRVDDVRIAPIIRGDGNYDPQSSFTGDKNLIRSLLQVQGNPNMEVDMSIALNDALTLIAKEASLRRPTSILILAASELNYGKESLKLAARARGLANIVVFGPSMEGYKAQLVDITHDRSKVILHNLKYNAVINYTARLLCHEESEQPSYSKSTLPLLPEANPGGGGPPRADGSILD